MIGILWFEMNQEEYDVNITNWSLYTEVWAPRTAQNLNLDSIFLIHFSLRNMSVSQPCPINEILMLF